MPGKIFRQADLARTLRSMVEAEKKALSGKAARTAGIDAVRDFFYRGDIARRIDAFSSATTGCCATKTWRRLSFTPEEPACTDLQGLPSLQAGLLEPGSGDAGALNILEGFDLRALGYNSAEYLHNLAETMKLAYADRDT